MSVGFWMRLSHLVLEQNSEVQLSLTLCLALVPAMCKKINHYSLCVSPDPNIVLFKSSDDGPFSLCNKELSHFIFLWLHVCVALIHSHHKPSYLLSSHGLCGSRFPHHFSNVYHNALEDLRTHLTSPEVQPTLYHITDALLTLLVSGD